MSIATHDLDPAENLLRRLLPELRQLRQLAFAGDPLQNFRVRSFPACGAVAGLYARIDTERGVWKAPAGTEAVVRGARGLAYTLTDGENGVLNPLGLNSLRTFPVFGTVVWGALAQAVWL